MLHHKTSYPRLYSASDGTGLVVAFDHQSEQQLPLPPPHLPTTLTPPTSPDVSGPSSSATAAAGTGATRSAFASHYFSSNSPSAAAAAAHGQHGQPQTQTFGLLPRARPQATAGTSASPSRRRVGGGSPRSGVRKAVEGSESPSRARRAMEGAAAGMGGSPRRKKAMGGGAAAAVEEGAAAAMKPLTTTTTTTLKPPRVLRKMKSVPALALRAAAAQQQQQASDDHDISRPRPVVGRKRSRTGKVQAQATPVQLPLQLQLAPAQPDAWLKAPAPRASDHARTRRPLETGSSRVQIRDDAAASVASFSSSSSRDRRRVPSHSRSSPNLSSSSSRSADPFAIVPPPPLRSGAVDQAVANPWGLAHPSELGDQSGKSSSVEASSLSSARSMSSGRSGIAMPAASAHVPLIDSSPETPLFQLAPSRRLPPPTREEAAADAEEEEDEIVDPKIIFSKERFLKRHSQDFSHLWARPRATADGAPPALMEEVSSEAPEPDADEERRALEEARRMGREKRRSWMLQRAGLAGTMPLSGGGQDSAASAASSSAATSLVRHHRRTSSTTFFAPSARGGAAAGSSSGHVRQTTLFGGPKPLTLVAAQNRRQLSQQIPMTTTSRSPIVEPFVTSPTDDEAGASPTSPMSAVASAAVATPTKRIYDAQDSLPTPHGHSPHSQHLASPSSSVATSRTPIPPHLRGASGSSFASSGSLSSLGHIIAGYSPGASTSSCSSGADHIGGPRELAPENFNFRMSISDRNSSRLGPRTDSRLTWTSGSLRRQTSLQTEGRLSQVDLGDQDEEVPVTEILEGNDPEARLVRRRARAFLMAGLKLERNSVARPDSGIAVEQHVEDANDTIKRSEPRRRAGIIVEGDVDVSNPDLDSGVLGLGGKTSDGRKRYSMLRREKTAAETTDLVSSSRSGSECLAGSIRFIPEAAAARDVGSGDSQTSDSDPSNVQPGISVSTFEDEPVAPPRPTVDRLVSDESNGTAGWQTLDSSEAASRLFWREDGVEPSKLAPKQDVRKVRSDGAMRSTYRSDDVATPIKPSFINPDENGASPGQKEKSSWTGGVRGWLRKGSTKVGTEGETEKGFGLGRGEEDRTATQQQLRVEESQARGRAPREKKSWRSFLVQPLARDESSSPIRLDDITVPPASLPQTSVTPGTLGASPLPSPSWFASPSLPPPTADLRLYSPSSANSYSPPTPAMFTATSMSASGHRESRRAPISIMQVGPSPHILSPTPKFPHNIALAAPKPTAKPYDRRPSTSSPTLPISPAIPMTTSSPSFEPHPRFATDTIPPQRPLHGLGLGVEMPLSAGLRTASRATHQPPNAPEHWEDDLAQHAFALIQLSQQARQRRIQEAQRQSHTTRVGLSGNQSLAERIFGGMRKRQNANRDGNRTPEAADVSWEASQSTVNLPQTPSDLYRDETRIDAIEGHHHGAFADKRAKARPASPTNQQEVIFRQKPGGLVPAKLFFMLGFLLGPWIWLIGGWALTPAGLFVPTKIGPSARDPVWPDDDKRHVLPPMRRDRPNKWVSRNRWAAVVSSAIFIPALCVGFACLGELL